MWDLKQQESDLIAIIYIYVDNQLGNSPIDMVYNPVFLCGGELCKQQSTLSS